MSGGGSTDGKVGCGQKMWAWHAPTGCNAGWLWRYFPSNPCRFVSYKWMHNGMAPRLLNTNHLHSWCMPVRLRRAALSLYTRQRMVYEEYVLGGVRSWDRQGKWTKNVAKHLQHICLTSDATPSACAPQQYTSIDDSSVDLILFLPSSAVVMGSQ